MEHSTVPDMDGAMIDVRYMVIPDFNESVVVNSTVPFQDLLKINGNINPFGQHTRHPMR